MKTSSPPSVPGSRSRGTGLGFAAGLAALVLAAGLPAPVGAAEPACSGWDAIYAAPLEDGGQIATRFAPGDDPGPHPFTLFGVDDAGNPLWRHKGQYWCYQGAGGCYVALGYVGKEPGMDDPDNRHRIVFVNADPDRDIETASDILVIAGLNSAFHYGQNSEELALDRARGVTGMVRVPEIFRFARCAREGE